MLKISSGIYVTHNCSILSMNYLLFQNLHKYIKFNETSQTYLEIRHDYWFIY